MGCAYLPCLAGAVAGRSAGLCDCAESIAFYNGDKHEERCASLRLVLLVAVVRIKIVWATFLALWTNFYQHATLLMPALLTAPRYFRGEIEFGVITQVWHCRVSVHLYFGHEAFRASCMQCATPDIRAGARCRQNCLFEGV